MATIANPITQPSGRQPEQFAAVRTPPTPVQPTTSIESQLKKIIEKFWWMGRISRPRRQYIWAQGQLFSQGIHFFNYDWIKGRLEEWSVDDQDMYCPVPLVEYAVENIASQYSKAKPRIVPQINSDEPKARAVAMSLQDVIDSIYDQLYGSNAEERQRESKLAPLRDLVVTLLEYDQNAGPMQTLPVLQGVPVMMGTAHCPDCGAMVDASAIGGAGNVSDVSGGSGYGSGNGVAGAMGTAQAGGMASSPAIQASTLPGAAPQQPLGSANLPGQPNGNGAGPGAQYQGAAIDGATGGRQLPSIGSTVSPVSGGALCPICSSPNLDTSGIQQVTTVQQTGTQQVPQGEVKRTVIDAFQWDSHERRFSIENSPYNRFDEIMFIEEAEEIYPDVKITGRAVLGGPSVGYNGLHILRQIETLVSNTGGLDQSKPDFQTAGVLGSYLEDTRCVRSRIFLKPVVLRKIVVGDENGSQLPGTPYVLPKGSRLSDVFPQGVCIHMVNDQIVRVESSARYRFCGYKYSIPTTGLYGVGIAPLVSLNKAYDELTSYEMQWALMASLGILLFDERIGQLKNKPGTGYPVPREAMPFEKPLASLVSWQTAGVMPPAVENLRQSFKNDLGSISMATNPNSEGMAPAAMDTATGVNYQEQAMNSLTAPRLELFAESCAKNVQYYIELESMFNQWPRCFASLKFGRTTAKWFSFLNIPKDVRYSVEEDSHQPRTQLDRRRDAVAFINAGGGQGHLTPEVEANLAKEFKQPAGANDYNIWSYKVQNVFDRIVEAEQQAQTIPAEVIGQIAQELAAANMPPSPGAVILKLAKAEPQQFDNGAMYARFIVEELYLSDRWDTFSPDLQDAIHVWYEMHQMNDGMQQQKAAEQQVKATEPIQQAAAAQAQAEQASQGDNGQEVAKIQAQAMAQDAQQSAEHQRSVQLDDQHQRNAIELQDRKHQQSLELERERAKLRPKATATAKKTGKR